MKIDAIVRLDLAGNNWGEADAAGDASPEEAHQGRVEQVRFWRGSASNDEFTTRVLDRRLAVFA